NLFNKDIMSLAPALSGAVIPSNPPAFIAPEDDGVASKLGKIKNLDGLELLAKAQAFDEAKKKDKDLTLSHFLENAKKPASTEGLNELSNLITNNDVNIEPPTSSSSTGGGHSTLRNYAPLTSTLKSEEGTPHTTPTENQPQIEYCPIGIWVAKWADLFPWLAMGINNNVNADDIEKSLNLIKKRTLLQDFITLGNIYKAVAQAKLGIYPDRRNSEEDLNDIVTAFTTQANLLSYPENYGKIDAYEKAIDRLNSNPLAALIYKHWSNIKFLRNCELGMGLYGDGNVLGGERHFSLIEDPNPPFYYGVTYSFKRSLFDLEAYKKNGHNSNFEAFADVIKGYPVIAPLEEETIFMLLVTEKGNQRGNPDRTTSAHFRYLIGQHWSYNYTKDGKWRATSCTLNSDPNTDFIKDRPAIFKSNPADKTLSANITGVDNGQLITAVPIPFTAAAGGKWKGGSFSTNLNSSQTLQNQIQNLQDELTKENAYSFSRDNAIFDNWNESPYSLLELPVSYMGLVPEVGNTFGNTINKSKRDDTK
ncbi:MAG: hypothetical protein Q8K92_27520, partial [Leadbetterella sp.]|nr:hypothetical protein [Leadbetterella sp.]